MWENVIVEAIEQPIGANASSHYGALERVQLSAEMRPSCAHSRVRSCSLPSLHDMGLGGGFKDGVKTFGCCMLLWLSRTDGA